jgi:hypothetical protein
MHKPTTINRSVPEIDIRWKCFFVGIAVLWLGLGLYAFVVFNL